MRLSKYPNTFPTSASKLLGSDEFGRTKNFYFSDIQNFVLSGRSSATTTETQNLVLISATNDVIFSSPQKFSNTQNLINIICESPTSGMYMVDIKIYIDDKLAAYSSLSNINYFDYSTLFVTSTYWHATMELVSGNYPASPIIVKVIKC